MAELSRSLPCLLVLLVSRTDCGTVTTKSGDVVGGSAQFEGLYRNGSYHSFRGIPYAQAPVGSLRFRDPVPVTAWDQPLDASGELDNSQASSCLQPSYFNPSAEIGSVVGSEDCLFLNVFTETLPKQSSSLDLKPVFFWIHGGGFSIGSGEMLGQQPDLLLEAGMVVVTINYRLGALGFFALEGTEISGNQGLKDQLMALRWVKQNIANFGGDPARITIGGESAGGVSVHSHVLSPLGKDEDLFHAAISFSGTMLMGMEDLLNKAPESSKHFYEEVCQVTSEDVELESSCLYSLPASEIMEKTSGHFKIEALPIRERMESTDYYYFFWPTVDYWAEEALMPTNPITILHNQQQKMVPFMSGSY